jgi:hypothetical protein
MPTIKTCACGRKFEAKVAHALTCSTACSRERTKRRMCEWRAERLTMRTLKTCICGREFEANHPIKLTCSPSCSRELTKRRMSEWRASNPERAREWRATNYERITDREREYRETNYELISRRNRAWRASNRERLSEKRQHQVLAYALLKGGGVAPDHLPTRGSRLWFAYRQVRRYPGVLPPPPEGE